MTGYGEVEGYAGVLTIMSSSSAPLGRGSRCWRGGSPPFCRPCAWSTPSRRRAFTASLTSRAPARHWSRPARVAAPPQTLSAVGLIGGGHLLTSGGVSRAHHGRLVLDARPECRRHVLEVLRQPLDKGFIAIPSLGRHCACSFLHPKRADTCAEELAAVTGGRDIRKSHPAALRRGRQLLK
jgi:hypothetical protein